MLPRDLKTNRYDTSRPPFFGDISSFSVDMLLLNPACAVQAYVFDVRGGAQLYKLGGHTDVVTSVAYHPLHPQLVTGSLNGRLRFFADSA